MKELLELKEKTIKEINQIEKLIKDNKDTKNFTGIVVMKNKLEAKKDLLKVLNIIYHLN